MRLNIMVATLLAASFWHTEANAQQLNEPKVQPSKEYATWVRELPEKMPRFNFDSGFTFSYPDAVRGIYVTGHSAGGDKFKSLTKLVDETDLNSMVIDIKDDHGFLTYLPNENSPFKKIGKPYIKDPKKMLKVLEEKKIYPIARIVVFKDTALAQNKPEWSFKEGKKVWRNGRGESFVNPFIKDVWQYNVDIAKEAAKMGFQEIQFDYVRFPEGFENKDKTLTYSLGEYKDSNDDNVQKRVRAVSEFVAFAKEELNPFNVKVSVDIFGYAATLKEAPGIGQNFSRIAENVDVISAMIYPSHWTSYFGIAKPDTEPYRLVEEYAKFEKKKLKELNKAPVSRPWLQDFTASWLGKGNYVVYGKKEVEDQIRALKSQGINEYLLWNASNHYTPKVDYTP